MPEGKTFLDTVIENAERTRREEKRSSGTPDDYEVDGILYCGICHTPKEVRINLPEGLYGKGKTRIVPCLCKHRQAEIKERQKQDDFEQRMLRVKRVRESSLMDKGYAGATFERSEETPDNRRALRIGRKYVENFREMYLKNQGILFYGPVGTGKSFTAACIANALMDSLTPVVMVSTVKIIQDISKFGISELHSYMDMLMSPSLLILDDLGAERNTDYTIEQIYNVIDARSRSGKPMIVTTNISLGEMMQTPDIRYKRIYDRVLATCYPVEIGGRSFRMISAEKRFDDMRKILEQEDKS